MMTANFHCDDLDAVEAMIRSREKCAGEDVPDVILPCSTARTLLAMAREYNKLAEQMRKLETCSLHGCKVTITKHCWQCAGETLDGIGG